MESQYLKKAFSLLCQAKHMAQVYEDNRSVAKYVHSTSRGHEAIQLAVALQLLPQDYVAPYYRDDAMLLGLGFTPYELMLQLLGKGDDYFSGGRSYYSHPSSKLVDRPKIPHQSSATGMQAIPATGMAQGVQYLELQGVLDPALQSIVVCSLGDGSVTEGEVSEAMQFAVLKQLPILYLVQDNDWGISVSSDEARTMDAFEYVQGFKGMKRMRCDGSDFKESYKSVQTAIEYLRTKRAPVLLHAKVPLLGHHTSGVRKEWYRSEADLSKHAKDDPFPKLKKLLLQEGIDLQTMERIQNEAIADVESDFQRATKAAEPTADLLYNHEFAPSTVTAELGERAPAAAAKVVMVDAALHACDELLRKHPEAVLFGQDVGRRLGGVFREAATLAEKHGDHRVFNTAIQEAYIVGATVGLSAVGVKAIVEIQFADYIFTGLNQLIVEAAKSYFLSNGKYPVASLLRVPIGAYGGGGPYHSGSIEAIMTSIKGIKVVYPSNAADMKGLLKSAYYDPNPVVMLEHKGLYWSKVPGTQEAMTPQPDEAYIIPLSKARVALAADTMQVKLGASLCIITYGMGVHWALNAAKGYEGCIEIIDLRTLYPMDETTVSDTIKKHGKCIMLTEEQVTNSFLQAVAGRMSEQCFRYLDAPIQIIGAKDFPAVPLNIDLEKVMLPNVAVVKIAIEAMLLN